MDQGHDQTFAQKKRSSAVGALLAARQSQRKRSSYNKKTPLIQQQKSPAQ
jgi:hypothetical protein